MIADRGRSGVVVSSTMKGDSYQAGIDDEDMAHMITLFTDLYSDTELACLREYSTNARDAQIEAGVDRPIEVSLPSGFAPFLTIRDFGIGLDEEDIRRIYSRYGKSTKRASNDFNGMLGLGCKSALTYAQNFTVESVKDGIKTLCSVTRVENGVPSFQVISSTSTDDANGTVVRIPARRHNDFDLKAHQLYRFWPEGSVLVDGKEPEKFSGLDLGTRTLTVEWDTYSMDIEVNLQIAYRDDRRRDSTSSNLIVMGGVPYPAPKLQTGLPYSRYVVATVSIGAVDFPPNREALMSTPKTNAVLAALTENLKEAAAEKVNALIEQAPSRREAIRIAVANKDLLIGGFKSLKFKGDTIPESVDGEFIYSLADAHRPGASQTCKGLLMYEAINAIFVTDFVPQKFTAPHKHRLLKYCEDNGLDKPRMFVMTREASVDTSWLDASQVINWEDVRKVKLPRASRANSGKPLGAYDVIVAERRKHIPGEEIKDAVDNGLELFHHRGNHWTGSNEATALHHFYPGCLVVCLPDNRFSKYLRLFPESKAAGAAIQEKYCEWLKGLSADQRLALVIDEAHVARSQLEVIDAAKVDDPDIKRAIRTIKSVDLTALQKSRKMFEYVYNTFDPDVKWTNPLKKYALLYDRYGRRSIGPENPHFYIYLNAAYAAMNA